MQEFFEMMVVTQLLALKISVRLGNDMDMPRNLAKSTDIDIVGRGVPTPTIICIK